MRKAHRLPATQPRSCTVRPQMVPGNWIRWANGPEAASPDTAALGPVMSATPCGGAIPGTPAPATRVRPWTSTVPRTMKETTIWRRRALPRHGAVISSANRQSAIRRHAGTPPLDEFQNLALRGIDAVQGSANHPARIGAPARSGAWPQEATTARLARLLTEDVAATFFRLEN